MHTVTDHPNTTFAHIPLSQIITGNNPRRYFDADEMSELITSIRHKGVTGPDTEEPETKIDIKLLDAARRALLLDKQDIHDVLNFVPRGLTAEIYKDNVLMDLEAAIGIQ